MIIGYLRENGRCLVSSGYRYTYPSAKPSASDLILLDILRRLELFDAIH